MKNVMYKDTGISWSIQARVDEHSPWVEVEYSRTKSCAEEFAQALDDDDDKRKSYINDALNIDDETDND